MGTLIKNKSLDIDFEVGEILQENLEIYERAIAEYLVENEFDNSERSESILYSAVSIGAVEAGFIPDDVFASKDDVLDSKPAKVTFLSARISEIVDSAKNEKVDIEYECPEITQRNLEMYEKSRNKFTKGIEYSVYEMAKAHAIMVRIGLDIGWISEDIISDDKIQKSKPNIVKYLANTITEALVEARTISGE